MTPTISSPPAPSSPAEALRVDHTRLRRRLLYGGWLEDAKSRLLKHLGHIRSDVVGDPDPSANPFRSLCSSVAALYDRHPIVRHATRDPHVEEALGSLVRQAALWPLMQRVQRDVLGLREMLLRIDARPGEGGVRVSYRPVFPDLVEAKPDPEDPERPVEIRELREWTPAGKSEPIWVWEVWSIRDPANPLHQIRTAQATGVAGSVGADISHLCGLPEGGLVGDAYPARWADGTPFLPYVVHHAARTGSLFDPFEGIEVVEGTLQVAVKWTLFGHFLRNASWSQRWVVGAEPAGVDVEGTGATEHASVPADPSFVLQLVPVGEGQASAGQWNVTVDPVSFAESIGIYERRLAAFAGLDPSDVQRVSGDPRSGYALAISREGKRESQRRYGPIFRPADEECVSKTAALTNRALGSQALPETGWEVEYQALPPSAEERAAERDHVLALMQAGLIDRDEAYRLLVPEAVQLPARNRVAEPPEPATKETDTEDAHG